MAAHYLVAVAISSVVAGWSIDGSSSQPSTGGNFVSQELASSSASHVSFNLVLTTPLDIGNNCVSGSGDFDSGNSSANQTATIALYDAIMIAFPCSTFSISRL